MKDEIGTFDNCINAVNRDVMREELYLQSSIKASSLYISYPAHISESLVRDYHSKEQLMELQVLDESLKEARYDEEVNLKDMRIY